MSANVPTNEEALHSGSEDLARDLSAAAPELPALEPAPQSSSSSAAWGFADQPLKPPDALAYGGSNGRLTWGHLAEDLSPVCPRREGRFSDPANLLILWYAREGSNL
jgi:hypothetical protein